jgi:hypothetical protein
MLKFNDINPIVARAWAKGRMTLLLGLFYLTWILLMFKFTNQGLSAPKWIGLWDQWDVRWYKWIWEEGYSDGNSQLLVFPPVYPYIVGSLSVLTGFKFSECAMVFNLVSYFAGLVIVSDVLCRRFRIRPVLSFLIFLSMPASYFAFSAYPDVLLFFLMWAAVSLILNPDSVLRKKVLPVLLLLIPGVQLTGYALLSWIFFIPRFAAVMLISLAAWLIFNNKTAGGAFYFLEAQKVYMLSDGWLYNGMIKAVRGLANLDNFGPERFQKLLKIELLPFAYFILMTLTGIWFWVKKERFFAVTVFAILLATHNQALWRSTVRHDLLIAGLMIVPLHSVLQTEIPHKKLKFWAFYILIVTGQFALQLMFARQFRLGNWAF